MRHLAGHIAGPGHVRIALAASRLSAGSVPGTGGILDPLSPIRGETLPRIQGLRKPKT
ncbi:hypothetical protein RR11_2701 [Ruegeria sp. R11]|nr:hypothetical protein RR11_2701 [Ruegeria sp. R11]